MVAIKILETKIDVNHLSEHLWMLLPDQIFAPLSSKNQRICWRILVMFYQTRFGPDVVAPPVHGFQLSQLIADIESELQHIDFEISEDEHLQLESISEPSDLEDESRADSRARYFLSRLVQAGWLSESMWGLVRTYSMGRNVIRLLGQLIEFSTEKPRFISGMVRTIEAHLKSIDTGEASGDAWNEAATTTRQLIDRIYNTRCDIQDLSKSLRANLSAGAYAKQYFTEFITNKFIGDYSQLRTQDHPLSRRFEINQLIERILYSPESKSKLLAWYEKNTTLSFVKDEQRLNEFFNIDEYLVALDNEVNRLNRQTHAYWSYKLGSKGQIDELIDRAINVIQKTSSKSIDQDNANAIVPFGRVAHLAPESCWVPRQRIKRAPPEPIKIVVITPEKEAENILHSQMKEARHIDPTKLSAYIERELGELASIASIDLKILNVTDLVAFQNLVWIGLASQTDSELIQRQVRTKTRGLFKVHFTDTKMHPREYLSCRPFVVERIATKRKLINRQTAAVISTANMGEENGQS